MKIVTDKRRRESIFVGVALKITSPACTFHRLDRRLGNRSSLVAKSLPNRSLDALPNTWKMVRDPPGAALQIMDAGRLAGHGSKTAPRQTTCPVGGIPVKWPRADVPESLRTRKWHALHRPTPRKPSTRAPSARRGSPSARWRSRRRTTGGGHQDGPPASRVRRCDVQVDTVRMRRHPFPVRSFIKGFGFSLCLNAWANR